METLVSTLLQNYQSTKEDYYFNELLKRFSPLLKKYAKKLYYLEYEDCYQELAFALFEAISKIKDTENEASCIRYIKQSVIHRFTKLYTESKTAQYLQSIRILSDKNHTFEKSASALEDCILTFDLNYLLKDKTKTEQTIINLLLQGYTDQEIAQTLGYSRQYVNRIKKKILTPDLIK